MTNRLSSPRSTAILKPHAYTQHFPADDSYPAERGLFEPKITARSTVGRRVVEENQEQEFSVKPLEMQKSTRNPDSGTLHNFLGFQVMGQYLHRSLL